ncbi:MAG: hypothetical protein WCI51_08290 [Lentisphaerota bacterium]
MDIIKVEKALTVFWAGVLNKTVDGDIFRGGIPSGKNGIGVMLGIEITPNEPSMRKFNAQILGKFTDRDVALAILEKAEAAIPVYGVEAGMTGQKVFFRAILKQGGSGAYRAPEGGVITEFCSLNFTVCLDC